MCARYFQLSCLNTSCRREKSCIACSDGFFMFQIACLSHSRKLFLMSERYQQHYSKVDQIDKFLKLPIASLKFSSHSCPLEFFSFSFFSLCKMNVDCCPPSHSHFHVVICCVCERKIEKFAFMTFCFFFVVFLTHFFVAYIFLSNIL